MREWFFTQHRSADFLLISFIADSLGLPFYSSVGWSAERDPFNLCSLKSVAVIIHRFLAPRIKPRTGQLLKPTFLETRHLDRVSVVSSEVALEVAHYVQVLVKFILFIILSPSLSFSFIISSSIMPSLSSSGCLLPSPTRYPRRRPRWRSPRPRGRTTARCPRRRSPT